MYSVVLATMLTAAAPAPAWCHGCFGCHGCHGCAGNAFSCGCCGGCHGCYGCGGCGGCWGGSGCWGCYGGGCNGACFGCGGCNGYTSCYGCWGCYGVASAQPAYSVAAYSPAVTVAAVQAKPAAVRTTQATVVVQLPAEAKLFVDDHAARLDAVSKSFVTPELQQGRDYVYTLRAEMVRDGQKVSQSREVIVRAGYMTRVQFDNLSPAVASTEAKAAEVTLRAR